MLDFADFLIQRGVFLIKPLLSFLRSSVRSCHENLLYGNKYEIIGVNNSGNEYTNPFDIQQIGGFTMGKHIILETKRTYLRQIRLDDFDEIAAILGNIEVM